VACLIAHVDGECSRLLNRLAQIRPYFMMKIVGPQTKVTGGLFEYLSVSVDRVQKRNAHGRYLGEAVWVDRYSVIVARTCVANKTTSATGMAATSLRSSHN
jgi:hypothetical protein